MRSNKTVRLLHYREILYGVAFGVSAWLVDVAMHASKENRDFWIELLNPEPATVVYRLLFLVFGLALGWLLWQRSRREREFRKLAAEIEAFRGEIAGPAFLVCSKLQLLLTREGLPPQAQETVRSVYADAQRIQTLVKEKLPSSNTLHS